MRGELAPASEERRRRRGWAESDGVREIVGRIEEVHRSSSEDRGVELVSSEAYGRMKDAHSRLRFSESAVRVKSYEDCYDMP